MDNHNSGWNPPRAQYPWKQGDELFADELNAAIANAITLGGQLSVATITDTPPVAQYIGQLWFDSSNPQLYVWYDDGTSAQWVIATANAGGLTTDAPSDGQTYGRQNGAWLNIAAGGGYLPISGATPMTGPLTIGIGTAISSLYLNGLSAQNNGINWQVAGVQRWRLVTDASNDLNLYAYDNSGTLLKFAIAFNHTNQIAYGAFDFQFQSKVGFNNTAPIAKPTLTGAKGSNAALASVIAALVAYGLATDTTTA